MLYIFHVDTGTMLTFDMNLAMESVAKLQQYIARACHISEGKQVLLISGGESLDPTARVSKYHAGTDTNPIYLFSKSTIEAATPPSPSVHYGSDIDIQSQVEGSLMMPPAYETVVSRAQLALQIQDVDKEELRACEHLVHDQHLQQQGWAAVVANLEDITSALCSRSEIFTAAYNEYLLQRESYLSTLSCVGGSLQLLSRIPVLPCLMQQTSDFSDKSESSSGSSDSSKSLLDWISSQDPQHSLQDMIDQCLKATEQLDQTVLETLTAEVQETFKQVNNPSMKEVKGLEDRLYGLDQIMSGAKNVVQEQSDMAQGFVQNQNRVSNLRDKSILPDLCSSHKKQLVVMVTNHKKLREIKKKCKMAKEELSVNLHTRLRWVMFVEKKICDVDGKLMIYHENLKRLKKRLDILKQVHDAPSVYGKLVVEVCCRKNFSNNYLKWATNLAEESTVLHTDEVKRRESFQAEVGHHFIQALFQGFEDFTQTFAMDAPVPFDQNLPDITMDDINMLKSSVPELEDVLRLPADIVFVFRQPDHTSGSMFSYSTDGKLDVPPLQKVTSLATSEIEIIKSHDEHLVDKDRSTISLGDQVASCEPDENIVMQSELVVGSSATYKPEFLMPKSLSEALTKEMQTEQKDVNLDHVDAAKKPKVDLSSETKSVGEVTASLSSGEQVKSTESDVSGQENINRSTEEKSSESNVSSRKRSVKTDVSPDMETSQEFTTADFYIEDSMPSSIADSPPNKPVQGKPNFEKLLEEKTVYAEKLEKELESNSAKIDSAKSKIGKLKEILNSNFPTLKTNLIEIKSCYDSDRQKFLCDLSETRKKLIETLEFFDSHTQSYFQNKVKMIQESNEHKTKELESKIENLDKCNEELKHEISSVKENWEVKRQEYEKQVQTLQKQETEIKNKSDCVQKELQETICIGESRIRVLNSEVTRLEKELEESKQKFDSEKIELEQKIVDFEQKSKFELEEVIKQHSLEMEVELDKVRAEFQVQLNELESEVKNKDNELIESNEKTKLAQKEKIHLEEMLTEQYQKEKEDITRILEESYKEQFEKDLQEEFGKIKENSKTEYEKYKLELEAKQREEIEKRINEMKEELNKEKKEELMKQETNLKDVHEKVLKETMQKMLTEKEYALQKQNEELSTQYAEDLEKCREILKVETDSLKTELSAIKDKEQLQQETQTEKLEIMQGTTQTEKVHLSLGVAQTDIREVTQGTVQTDHWQGIQGQTQTDNWQGIMGETQTDRIQVLQMETQTCVTEVTQGHVQTDSKEISDKSAQAGDSIESILSREEHNTCMRELEARFKEEKQIALDKALKDLQEQHDKEIGDIISKLEKDKEDSVSSLKTSITAEKQVMFNEAVNKVSQEKDRIIDELKQKEQELLQQQIVDKELIDKLTDEKSKLDDIKNRAVLHINDKDRELSMMKKRLEDELALKNQQISQYQQQLESASQMQVSSAPSVLEISHLEGVDSQTRINELTGEIQNKNEEILQLKEKLNEITMSASTRSVVQDKVSITSCNIGDLVLFCLDERHDQYVVFTIGSTLHFLHTDCLDTLGLRTSPGESRKSWVLAEITDKEYCQAKKTQNRFKVPVGTKFYRVKAKQWSRESLSPGSKKEAQAMAAT